MSLSTKQRRFTECIGKVIAFAYSKGWGLTFGDAYRDSRAFGFFGIKKLYSSVRSVHKIRLAVDFNLFVDNKYIKVKTPEYEELGEYWESLDTEARWGGRFTKPDPNHFSFTHWGVK